LEIKRSVLVPFSVEDMFDLIEQAEDYPLFLPWCVSSKILERSDDWVAARIDFKYLQVRFGFATRNPKQRPEWLKVRMVEGPFRHFHADWLLTPLGADGSQGCRINFDLSYEVSDGLLDRVAARAVEMVARSMMDAFVKRAEETLKPAVARPQIAVNEQRAQVFPEAPRQPEESLAPAKPDPAVGEPSPAVLPALVTGALSSPPPEFQPSQGASVVPVAAVPLAAPAAPTHLSTTETAMTLVDPALLEAVRHCALSAELNPEQAAVLAGLMQMKHFGAREVVAPEDLSDNRLCVIVSGELAAIKAFGSADEERLVSLKPGDFAHELGFLDGAKRYASLVATEPSTVLLLEREALESLIDSHPVILYRVMCAIVRTVHRIQTRLSVQASELTNYIVKQHGRY
jgi:CRP/FNR family transcriptional regulator, cyclic AMP receptor protein